MEENKICKCCYSKSGEGVRGGVHGTLDWREGNRQTLISPFVFRPTRLEWFPTQRHSNSWRDLITSLQTGGVERSGGIASQLPNKKWPLWLNPPQTHREAPGFCVAHMNSHAQQRGNPLNPSYVLLFQTVSCSVAQNDSMISCVWAYGPTKRRMKAGLTKPWVLKRKRGLRRHSRHSEEEICAK